MARLVSSVSDVLDTLQKERAGARPRLKADLQRAPARGARPRGCSNGEPTVGGEKKHPGWSKPSWGRDLGQCRGWRGGGGGGRWKGVSWNGEFSQCSSQLFINQPKNPFPALQTHLLPTESSRGTGRAFISMGWA